MCDTLYELLSGSPASERPDHFYMDQRFALVLLATILILPMSIHKEIAVHKYSRSAVKASRAANKLALEVITAGQTEGGPPSVVNIIIINNSSNRNEGM